MANQGQVRTGLVGRPGWFSFLAIVLGMSLMVAGCDRRGGDVDTDPTMGTELPGDGEIEDVDPVDPPDFGGDGTGGGDVSSEDMEDVAPAVVLQDVFFEYDQSELSSDSQDALAQNSRLLRENSSLRILVEGHCDERGTIQYNLALGERRALEVKNYLMSLGIGGTRIDVVSYGKERPFVAGSNEAAWSQNRRAHFVVLN